MIKAKNKKLPVVLVSWVSVNHKANPILTVLESTHKNNPFVNRVKHLYLFFRDVENSYEKREYDALNDTITIIKNKLNRKAPNIIKVRWKTNKSPTDHHAIYNFVQPELRKIRAAHPNAQIVIHLSPGTPSMHSVWLILGSTGAIEGPIALVQTADQRGVDSGSDPVQIINLKLNTWLHRFRQTNVISPDYHDTGHLWDPLKIQSPRLLNVLKQLEEWAPLRIPVLITGERGTGKTTAANYLRSKSPFQKLDLNYWPTVVCGQFKSNPQLARSELFGHVKGSFTGADSNKDGLLKKLDGDTLFLDELSDIDRDTQRLLIAALEGRGFNPVGDSNTIFSNFRLITATNKLIEDIVGKEIDPDFYDRISVFVVQLPPLRNCKEDIPLFWSEVLSNAVKNCEVFPDRWEEYSNSELIINYLQNHNLHGNFRDIQKLAYHLIAALNAGREETQIIKMIQSVLPVKPAHKIFPFTEDQMKNLIPLESDVRSYLNDYRVLWVDVALSKSNGNVSKAAQYLKIPRKTLDEWNKKHSI